MKIAIIIENYRLNSGGGGNERSTEQIVRRLVQRGHEATIFCNRSDAGSHLPPGCRLVVAGGLSTSYGLGLWLFVGWVKQQIAGGSFDVTLSMTTSVAADVIQPRSGMVCEAFRRRLAMQQSGWPRFLKRLALIFHLKRRLTLLLERRTVQCRRVRRFVAISEYVLDQLVRHYGIDPGRIVVIPNAAEILAFSVQERETVRRELRVRHGIGEKDLLFFFAAIHPELKGLRELLKAFAEVVQNVPSARLLVAGTSSHAMRRLAEQPVFAGRIAWVGVQASLDAFYVASDVTVLPTWSDSSSKVVLESLLHGTPAISTLHNGASRWIWSPDGRRHLPSPFESFRFDPSPDVESAGCVIDSPDNVQALVQAMTAMSDSGTLAACTSAASRLSRCVGMDDHVDRLEELLKEVASEVQGATADSGHAAPGVMPASGDNSRPLSLLFVIEKYFEFGGLQRDILRIAQACAQRGHQVHVLCGGWEGPAPQPITFHCVKLKSWTNHGRITDLEEATARFVREHRMDGVVGFKKMRGLDVYFAGDVCLAARLDQERAGIRRWLPRYRAYLAKEQAVFEAGSSTHILTITPIEQENYRKYYGTPAERLHLLPPGINRERLVRNVPSDDDRRRLRAEWGVKPGGLMFLSVGSGFHTKGVDRTIEALASLPQEVRNGSMLVVMGVGKPDVYLRQARRLGIGDRVKFTGGRSDVANFYYSADLLVHPARVEAAGHALLEAMVCGLPVLATGNCGYAHYVSDAEAGLVCAEPFKQAILNRLLHEAVPSGRREAWRKNALAYAQSRDLYGMVDRAADMVVACLRERRRIL